MITEIPINARTRDWLVRKLVDWGYLDAGDCFFEDERENVDGNRKLGLAIGRALPRLLLEAERNRSRQAKQL